jgi:lipopolysaccharide/colanic/teichoic acid biosynthesis glycosyltransferase
MSFIGPRAFMEEEVKEFNLIVPYFSVRHMVKPGITGGARLISMLGQELKMLQRSSGMTFSISKTSPLFFISISC